MRTGFDAEGDPEGKEGVLQTGKFDFRARYVREIGDTTGPEVVTPLSPSLTPGGSSSAHDAVVDAITDGISRLGGSWDEKKKEQWESAFACG
ncbi:hypothetical protein E4U38_001367 [Claviceps purpurea]|nr:hypothetical protein E4U38_001367 [Claviceps purpurea]